MLQVNLWTMAFLHCDRICAGKNDFRVEMKQIDIDVSPPASVINLNLGDW